MTVPRKPDCRHEPQLDQFEARRLVGFIPTAHQTVPPSAELLLSG
jgi:hypothetical protein